MFGSSLLEVVIGLAFMFTLLSLTCSSLNELYAQYTKKRAKNLKLALTRMLGETHVDAFYRHPLLRSLSSSGGEEDSDDTPSPSYIPNATMASIVLQIVGLAPSAEQRAKTRALRKQINDISAPGFEALRPRVLSVLGPLYACHTKDVQRLDALHDTVKGLDGIDKTVRAAVLERIKRYRERAASAGKLTVETLTARVVGLDDSESLKHTMLALINASDGTIPGIKDNIEGWYDDVMDRASGWYKRGTQRRMLIIASLLVVFGNVDALAVADMLWREPAMRAQVVSVAAVASASQAQRDSPTPAPTTPPPNNNGNNGNNGDNGDNGEEDDDFDDDDDDSSGDPAPAPAPEVADLSADPLGIYRVGFPIGWKLELLASLFAKGSFNLLSKKIAGLVISLLAAAQGAPFWFDLLNKLVNLRGSGRKPSASNNS